MFGQVCKHSVHRFVFRWKFELCLFFFCNTLCRFMCKQFTVFSEQSLHSLWERQSVKLLHKLDRTAADLILVVKPIAAVDHDAVVLSVTVGIHQLMLFAASFELFALETQKLHQINCVCSNELFVCKWDICHIIPPYIDCVIS